MPTLNLGRVGFVNKGAYVDATVEAPHKVNDLVQLNSVTYACIQYHDTPHLPTDALYWQKWTDYGIHSVSDISGVATASADSQYVNYFTGTAGVSTGVISIKLSDIVNQISASTCTVCFEIEITQSDRDLTLGTNPASYKIMVKADMTNGVWYNAQSIMISSSVATPLNVRFTRNATDGFIEIGETSTEWNYPVVEVSHLINTNTVSYSPVFIASINAALLGTTTDFIIPTTRNNEETKGADVASASSITIGTAGQGNLIYITGTTTITSLGNANAGTNRKLIFNGALTLTHNATSLILPSGVNITTAAGDCAEFECITTNNWKLINYTFAGLIHNSPLKAVPILADEFCIWDSVTGLLNKIPFTNLLSFLDTFYSKIGISQTNQDLTASRVSGVTYTNSTGKAIHVFINGHFSGGGPFTFEINTVVQGSYTYIANGYFSFSFIVPNGATYKATCNISKWSELR